MNWFSNLTRPGLKRTQTKRDVPDNLWIKCPQTGELIYRSDLDASCWVTPSGFHMRVGPEQRFKHMFDGGVYAAISLPEAPRDPLRFKDDKRYIDRIKSARAKTGREDCMAAAYGRVGGAPAVVLVQDFEFMAGSLGMAAGEGFIAAAQEAIARRAALVVFTASGGARMQEGVLSLMQLPRTTLAIRELRDAGLPYIVVLCDPTTGGVTASYAMLGDVHLAEPNALICFAGPRVIEDTIRQKLPEGFQRSEFLHQKGMVDRVVDRREMKGVIASLLNLLMAADMEAVYSDGLSAGTSAVTAPSAPTRARPMRAARVRTSRRTGPLANAAE
ncbi:MAG: acetyl-CoA carboxylase carboxyl transferase subunit beta [Hyphomonadaceae bacterium]|nr:acetyl-CoA carboxylase carboxyl transferase subunit beta [Hyphomonadaceae bacterium]